MQKLIKPDGREILVNENSLDYAINVLGWKMPEEKAAPKRSPKSKKEAP